MRSNCLCSGIPIGALVMVIPAILVTADGVISGAAGATGVTLAIDGRTNATPTIAAVNRFVAVVWGATRPGGATDVHSAVSHDGGHTFTVAVRVSDVDGNASLGGEQPPHVSLVPRARQDPAIVVVWTAKAKEGTVCSWRDLTMAVSRSAMRRRSPAAQRPATEDGSRRRSTATATSWRCGSIIAKRLLPWIVCDAPRGTRSQPNQRSED